ncbi:MAG: YfcE family phosphodiesterase [Myxococcota bacterium]
MRIGVVSDTHNHLKNTLRIVELLNEAGVERVVHTGDITQAKTLHAMSGLRAPLYGVYGNNDLERESLARASRELDIHLVDPPLRLSWAGRSIVVVHDPLDLAPDLLDGVDLAIHGHDHRHRSERRNGALLFNPGECAGHVPGLNQVGVVDLVRLETHVLRF